MRFSLQYQCNKEGAGRFNESLKANSGVYHCINGYLLECGLQFHHKVLCIPEAFKATDGLLLVIKDNVRWVANIPFHKCISKTVHWFTAITDQLKILAININGKDFKLISDGRKSMHSLAYALMKGDISYPSYVILDDKQQTISRFKGFRDAQDFMVELQTALQ